MNAAAKIHELRTEISGPSGLPELVVNGRPLRDVTEDALSALEAANEPAVLFVRGGALARVTRDENGRASASPVGEHELRGLLARVANFRRVTKDGDRSDVAPPLEVVRDVLALAAWPFPPLESVLEAPALGPDGSVLAAAGYHRAARAVYAPAPGFRATPVKADPASADVRGAVGLLLEALEGFPFVDQASRANALALLLTPVVRPTLPGSVPLALLDATKAGTGKGLLAGLVSTIATGRPPALLAAPVREEEWAKTILASVIRAAAVVVIDEAAELRSPTLAAALTAPYFEGRVLGRSEIVQLPQRATWAAAGNNVRLHGDLARRCYWIRLDAKSARPWTRTGFRHADLLAWAQSRRADLLAALLTIARAWYADGQPAASVPALGGFDGWAQAVGGMLAHAGIDGFLANLDELYDQADEEAAAWEAFLLAWADTYGTSPIVVADLTSDLLGNGGRVRDALPDELAAALDRSPASLRSKLGKALGKRAGTRYGALGHRIERAGEDSSKRQTWRLAVDEHQPGGPEVPEVLCPTWREKEGFAVRGAAGTSETSDLRGGPVEASP